MMKVYLLQARILDTLPSNTERTKLTVDQPMHQLVEPSHLLIGILLRRVRQPASQGMHIALCTENIHMALAASPHLKSALSKLLLESHQR